MFQLSVHATALNKAFEKAFTMCWWSQESLICAQFRFVAQLWPLVSNSHVLDLCTQEWYCTHWMLWSALYLVNACTSLFIDTNSMFCVNKGVRFLGSWIITSWLTGLFHMQLSLLSWRGTYTSLHMTAQLPHPKYKIAFVCFVKWTTITLFWCYWLTA